MSKLLSKSLLFSPIILAATLLTATGVKAAEIQPQEQTVAQLTTSSESNVLQQVNRYSQEGNINNSLDQVTNVSQFSDVRPGDWAYEALRQLVERYGCIAGYPDGTYRGNRAMTRYEFAAGLNSCLKQVERLIAASTTDFATKEDLETIRRLTQEFQAELATLGTRVDKLEGRVAFLENHQFSTTTKLVGEAIFALTDEFSERNLNTVFGDRVRLDFQTSFTGRDKLHTRLAAGNLSAFNSADPKVTPSASSAEGTQTFNLFNNANSIDLDWLAYEFPFGSSQVYIAATGGLFADFAPTLNPYFDNGDGGNGALSTFAQYSPIYRLGGGAGAGIRFGIGRAPILGPTSVTLGYLADNANQAGVIPGALGVGTDGGIFKGDYAALGQINFTLADRLGVGLTYVHGYHTNQLFDIGSGMGVVGNQFANLPRSIRADSVAAVPMVSNSYGVQAAFRLSNRVSLSGFGGLTNVRVLQGGTADANVWYYGAGLAFPDLGKKGNLAGIFAGVEPYVAGLRTNGTNLPITRDMSFHIEGFYKYQLTDNISITPGVIWITAPNQNENAVDSVIGTLRTTFTF